ncbi:MAG: isoaspartyl peptidase/L-asparaginase [Bacteroidota bacterium]
MKTTLVKETTTQADYAMAIHGGAGTILKKNMTAEKEEAIRKVMNEALSVGEKILKEGGSSLDAIEQTIMVLENSPYFNAGKGAVFTNAGENELDASIMDGASRNAGAVGGVKTVKNPILAARAVMERSEHVLLTGKGADEFAREQGIEIVEPSYFHTPARWESLQKAKAKEKEDTGYMDEIDSPFKYGTVGAVALDKAGNLAAGTSTGGMTNKRFNRIGDSPIIGAGTYANNKTCAISCTGHGEFFIRYAVAYDVSALMEYKGLSLDKAARQVVNEKLKEAGGSGGLIAVDHLGNVSLPFNTPGMYRGYVKPEGRAVMIYQE